MPATVRVCAELPNGATVVTPHPSATASWVWSAYSSSTVTDTPERCNCSTIRRPIPRSPQTITCPAGPASVDTWSTAVSADTGRPPFCCRLPLPTPVADTWIVTGGAPQRNERTLPAGVPSAPWMGPRTKECSPGAGGRLGPPTTPDGGARDRVRVTNPPADASGRWLVQRILGNCQATGDRGPSADRALVHRRDPGRRTRPWRQASAGVRRGQVLRGQSDDAAAGPCGIGHQGSAGAHSGPVRRHLHRRT